jgi:cellulose synthase/poly-beta-1,6-N-acetylglucosamine synthase-like glycosyltransferase
LEIFIAIFWIEIGILLYTYVGYLLVLTGLTKLIPSNPPLDSIGLNNWPKVSLVVAAYNEERSIGGKINNFQTLDYPFEMVEAWIASDGSSDETNEIVQSFGKKDDRIHLLDFRRSGKSNALNQTIPFVTGDIVVFSDANTEFAPDALKQLTKHFSDPRVGCVSGRLIYRNPGGAISGKGETFYWKYETRLKVLESRFGFIAGANGAIYAIRRNFFEPLPLGTINDDFTLSMQIVKKGYRSIYEKDAIAYEDVAPDIGGEFKRHVRDGAGHYIAISHLLDLLNPLLGTRSFIYWSHRILRWAAPFILIALFFQNICLLNGKYFGTIFTLQVIFYGLALLGLAFAKSGKLPFFLYVPFYFCNLNLALVLGFLKAILGKQEVTWDRTERV